MSFTATPITSIERHHDRLIFLTIKRPEGFHYKPGQFVRIGVPIVDNPKTDDDFLMRPYSLASDPASDELQFYIARVKDGELSPKLFDLKAGDTLYVDSTAYGLMDPERLQTDGTLMCLATGTGVASFLSILKANPFKRFRNMVVLHCAATADELTMQAKFEKAAADIGMSHHFRFIPVTTRECNPEKLGEITKRIPDALADGTLEAMYFTVTPEALRVMICGNPEFVKATKKVLKEKGFTVPRGQTLGTLTSENF